jgi:hypothetical protein
MSFIAKYEVVKNLRERVIQKELEELRLHADKQWQEQLKFLYGLMVIR